MPRLITYLENETPPQTFAVHVFVLCVCLCPWMQLSLFIEPGEVTGQQRQIGGMARGMDRRGDRHSWRGRKMFKILMRI